MTARKELKRQYKDTPRPMGTYRILNTANGKAFVGSSVDLPSMLNRERSMLRLGAHRNRGLSEDWKTFGSDAFTFEILETLEPLDTPGYDPREDLDELLAIWLERLSPYPPNGYNPPAKDSI